MTRDEMWCENCRHFTACDVLDPNDTCGKCMLQFDPKHEYGSDWICRRHTCQQWEQADEAKVKEIR